MKSTTKLSLNAQSIWAEVEAVQAKARTRKLDPSDVDLFVFLVNQAVKTCEKYHIGKDAIAVEITGGAVCGSYKQAAQTTILRCQPEMKPDAEGKMVPTGEIEIVALRGYADKTPWGVNKPHARIRVPAGHPSRQAMKDCGLIEKNDQYARVYRAS